MNDEPRNAAGPSHAGRIAPPADADVDDGLRVTEPREALKRPLFELDRYAGWLAKGHVSVAVRADVRALGAAMDAGHDTSQLLLTLDKDIARLPSGDIRKMLRRALGEVQLVLGPGAIGAHDGEGS
jgi:hypothetical protein